MDEGRNGKRTKGENYTYNGDGKQAEEWTGRGKKKCP